MDISKFFIVNKSDVQSSPCKNSAHKCTHTLRPEMFLMNCPISSLNITTITIGRKWLGRKSADEQYNIFVKRIKSHIPYHSNSKYVYHFELTNNGQLHAHGLEYNSWQSNFVSSFADFGHQNTKSISFKPVAHAKGLLAYIDYMDKENAYPMIHNIMKKDHNSINGIKSKMQMLKSKGLTNIKIQKSPLKNGLDNGIIKTKHTDYVKGGN